MDQKKDPEFSLNEDITISLDWLLELGGKVVSTSSRKADLHIPMGALPLASEHLGSIAREVTIQATIQDLYRSCTHGKAPLLSICLNRPQGVKALKWLMAKKLVSVDSFEGISWVIPGPIPPREHPLDLLLYHVDIGVDYWLALPEYFKNDPDLPSIVSAEILEAEGSPVTDDPLKQFEKIYCDDPPRPEDISLISREWGIRTPCHVDDGRGFITMWAGFCEMLSPGILACSEW